MKLHDSLSVYVELDGRTMRAGELGASFLGGRQIGGSWFRYEQGYVDAVGAYPLSPDLEFAPGTIRTGADRSLFLAFQDLTPDDWGRMIIDAKLSNDRAAGLGAPSTIGEFDYLSLSGDTARLGAIRFQPAGGGEWVADVPVPRLEDHGLDAFTNAAARFEEHEANEADLELLGAPGTSAGGARPKVAAMVDGKLKMLKLPSERDRDRGGEAWEFVAIELAQRAGISVQSGRLLRSSGGSSTLVVDRFDRRENGDRIGFISARTAMGLAEHGHDSTTYEDFADTVDHLSGGDRRQLRDLFKRIALTVLINNVDDHWKNHGFLRDGGRWRLSPAFDINPSRSVGAVMSRAISPKDDPRRRDIRHLAESRSVYSLSASDAGRALGEVLDAVRGWPEVARAAGIPDSEITHMARAFSPEQQEHALREITMLSGGGPSTTISIAAPGRSVAAPAEGSNAPQAGAVWVRGHMRGGAWVEGFWRAGAR